jgi:hypothetical protein
LSQSGSDRRGHAVELPADLLFDCARPFGGGQTGRLGGIGGGAQGVRAHVRDGSSLTGRPGGGRGYRSPHITSGAAGDESATDLFGDADLATSEGSRPGDRVTGTGVARSFRLEQSKHAFRAICRPRRDDPTVSFA